VTAWKHSPTFHLQSFARRQLLGTDSHNPSLAAKFLLGRGRVSKAKRFLARRLGRRPFFKDNPVPALVGALAGLGGITKRLKGRAARDAERAANTDAQAAAVLAAPPGSPTQELALQAMQNQNYATASARAYHATKLAQVVAAIATQEQAASRERGAISARERKAEAAAAAARGERREELIGGTLASLAPALLGRGRRRAQPRRRKRRTYSY
jgi:hypothetical protein